MDQVNVISKKSMNAPYLGKAKITKEKDMQKFNSKINKILDQKVCEF